MAKKSRHRARAARAIEPAAVPAARGTATGPPRWYLALIATAAIVPYLNALPNAFVWDDLVLVVDNPWIKSWAGLPHLLSASLVTDLGAAPYYRPLQAVTYLLDYRLWGLSPAGFRATGVAIHAGVALLLYRLGCTMLGSPRAALAAALAFAVHPIHTEAVAYVAGRSDPLAAACMLGALVCVAERRATALAPALFGLALLAREAAMVLPLLVVLVELARPDRDAARLPTALRRAVPYVIVLAVYLLVRRAVVGDGAASLTTAIYPLATRLLTFPGVIVRYLALLVAPVGLHMERTLAPATSLLDPAVIGAALVVAGLGGAIAAAWRPARPLAFGLAWFLVALLPVSGIVPLATFMAEHWLYVPSMGIFLAAGWAVDRLATGGARWALPAGAVALVAYAALTARRNLDWRDDLALFEATSLYAPNSVRVQAGLGLAYKRRGRTGEAIAAYEQALALGPSAFQSGVVHNNLGNLYRQLGRLDDSQRELEAAVQADPGSSDARNNLAATLIAMGRADDALRILEEALARDPNAAATHTNLGALYAQRGQIDRARSAFERALLLDPNSADAHNNMGSIYLGLGDLAQAEREYRAALRIDPGATKARANLDEVMRRRGAAAPR